LLRHRPPEKRLLLVSMMISCHEDWLLLELLMI
jgi:hypothetical protein